MGPLRGPTVLQLSQLDCRAVLILIVALYTAHGTPFCMPVDARCGITTGISAGDRAITVRVAMDPDSNPQDLVAPGHLPVLAARGGGVLERAGHTEASVELAHLTDLRPGAVVCEIMNDDGSMSRCEDLQRLAREHNLPMLTVRDLIEHVATLNRSPRPSSASIRRLADAHLPIGVDDAARVVAFADETGREHLAMLVGEADTRKPVPVRLHSQCLTGDALGSRRCDCGPQLQMALRRLHRLGGGVLLYLAQEGRGIGLGEKIRAYALQDSGLDTVDANVCLGHQADERDYGFAADILRSLGIEQVRLLTNNPAKLLGLRQAGITVTERIDHTCMPTQYNRRYLATKRNRLGHLA